MTPGGRGTQTGLVWEDTLIPALERAYPGRVGRRKTVGRQLFGGPYVADIVVESSGGSIIVSAKWQQVQGTAEQKLLYEIASLIRIVAGSQGRYAKAYVVVGGPGFSRRAREFLLGQGHLDVLKDGHLVEVMELDRFICLANNGRL